MINKKLVGAVPESKAFIYKNVLLQWLMLVLNVLFMSGIAWLIQLAYFKNLKTSQVILVGVSSVILILIRYILTQLITFLGFQAARPVKFYFREKIYKQLDLLGPSYTRWINTSELVQLSTEGIDQLESYFSGYLPQLFYSLIAPLTLFIIISFINIQTALVLLICTPLMPLSIAAVQTLAKKLFAKYWGEYVELGDSFLENLQGLTTLKIYQSDAYKHHEMNLQAERFRKATMRVLVMQLNSVTIMDVIAFGGAAAGMIMGITQFSKGHLSIFGIMMIILLAADFFIPMRRLGSFFHIAMNGVAASRKIFDFIEIDPPHDGNLKIETHAFQSNIEFNDLSFSYDGEKQVLDHITMTIQQNKLTAIVGVSGSGKSTLASILTGYLRDYKGSILIGDLLHREIERKSLMTHITYVGSNSYIFSGTLKEHLEMANPQVNEDDMWQILEKVKLSEFVKSKGGLDFNVSESGANLSGGQKQRLAIAEALIKPTQVYIFDEATSNIDVESERLIMNLINELSHYKTVILITHHLLNVVDADIIYYIQNGKIVEEGSHNELIKGKTGEYKSQWQRQSELENIRQHEGGYP